MIYSTVPRKATRKATREKGDNDLKHTIKLSQIILILFSTLV